MQLLQIVTSINVLLQVFIVFVHIIAIICVVKYFSHITVIITTQKLTYNYTKPQAHTLTPQVHTPTPQALIYFSYIIIF